jgi:Zn ribbon nucleic-acid-binding protein
MKLCRHCLTEQPDDAFQVAAVVKGKVYYRQQCNRCKKAREAERMATLEAWLRDYKKTLRCVTCGFADFRALAFHHINREEKEFNVSQMARLGHGMATIQREIAKCIVLCFNCHRIKHFEEWMAARFSPALRVATSRAALLGPEPPLVGTRKVCRYCLIEQDESFFEVCKILGNRVYRRHKCRACKAATQKRRRHRLRDWLESLKQTLECAECGFDDFRALEFHHTDGQEKDFAIGEMLKDNRSVRAVEREIAKCVVLCANCHRIEHVSEWAEAASPTR